MVGAGVDMPGGDYSNFDLASADPNLCQSACAGDQVCAAWTYVKPGVQGPKALHLGGVRSVQAGRAGLEDRGEPLKRRVSEKDGSVRMEGRVPGLYP